MLTITKTFRFEAAHRLPDHDGKCARLHGHSYRMDVTVRRDGDHVEQTGPKAGMVYDFGDLKRLVSELVDSHLDHHHLNETVPPEFHPTTAENLCSFVACWLSVELPPHIIVHEVTIHETCTGRATWSRE